MDKLATEIREKAGEEYLGAKRAVLLYSGGLDSRVAGAILQEWGVQIEALVLDMGGPADAGAVEKQAREQFGRASRASIIPDILSAAQAGVKTNCVAMGYLNAGGFSRPAMAQAAVAFARSRGIDTVVHGHSGLSDDHLRFELSMRAIAPELRALCPARDWDLRRDKALDYAARQKWKMPASTKSFSLDENVWGRTAWQGDVMDPASPAPEEAYGWGGVKMAGASDSTDVILRFEHGVAIEGEIKNGKKRENISGDSLIPALNSLGAAYAIGRHDVVVDKILGPKLREVHEGPAAEMLVAAHKELESLTLTTRERQAKEPLDLQWNQLVYEGGWFSRLRHYLQTFVEETQGVVEGEVRLRLQPGRLTVMGRASRHALYDPRLGGSDSSGAMSQGAGRSLARLMNLQETLAYRMMLEK
ncbi:Argininosuccinate synthase [uncultured archaeon]|nr:Argininosuccinate synthase [uncultured archaeon]